MTVLKKENNTKQQQQSFARMNQYFYRLQTLFAEVDTLSMGMSGSFIPAIHEGATLVRVGSNIFN